MKNTRGRYEEFTPATIAQVAHEISQGIAHPADARRLLELFAGKNPTPEAIAHVVAAIRAHLSGGESLDAAFGIVRKKGKPKADEMAPTLAALQVLELRMDGTPHQAAVDMVAGIRSWGATKVSDAWREHKDDARIVLDIRLATTGETLGQRQQAALEAIFK